MKLVGNRVHLKPLPQAAKSAGGIVYAASYQDDRMRYRVLAVGPGRKNKRGVTIGPECEPGDCVLAPLYHEHVTLPDGTIICDASALIAKWREHETAGGV